MRSWSVLALVAGGVAPSVALASDFGSVAGIAMGVFGGSICALAALSVFAMGSARDPRKWELLARIVYSIGLLAGVFGLLMAGSELVRQGVSFGAFVIGSVIAGVCAFLRFETRAARARSPDP